MYRLIRGTVVFKQVTLDDSVDEKITSGEYPSIILGCYYTQHLGIVDLEIQLPGWGDGAPVIT